MEQSILNQSQLITLDSKGYYIQIARIVGETKRFNLIDKNTNVVEYSTEDREDFKRFVSTYL